MPSLSQYLIFLLIMSLLTFIVWGVDKAAAISGKWRVSERTLYFLVFLGGAVGGTLGMLLFRHKTRKSQFRLALWAAGILQLAFLLLILFRGS